MTAAEILEFITAAGIMLSAAVSMWNAHAIHRVHVQFNSRFDQLIDAAELRGAAIERGRRGVAADIQKQRKGRQAALKRENDHG